MKARRVSFLVAGIVNATMLSLNLVVLVLQAWHGGASGLAVTNESAAAVSAMCLFGLTVVEHRTATEQAIRDSYLLEQQADTKMKQLMVEQVESGKAGLAISTSMVAAPPGRSH